MPPITRLWTCSGHRCGENLDDCLFPTERCFVYIKYSAKIECVYCRIIGFYLPFMFLSPNMFRLSLWCATLLFTTIAICHGSQHGSKHLSAQDRGKTHLSNAHGRSQSQVGPLSLHEEEISVKTSTPAKHVISARASKTGDSLTTSKTAASIKNSTSSKKPASTKSSKSAKTATSAKSYTPAKAYTFGTASMFDEASASASASLSATASTSATASASATASSYANSTTSTEECNTANDRSVWCDDFSIDTDYYNEVPYTGETVEYWFEVTDVTVAPDSYSRYAQAINGSIPGPLIEANWGDEVVVHLTNSLESNGSSIHFHGMVALEIVLDIIITRKRDQTELDQWR